MSGGAFVKTEDSANLGQIQLEVEGKRNRDELDIIGISQDGVHPVGGREDQDGIPARRTEHPHHIVKALVTPNSKKDVLLLYPAELANLLLLGRGEGEGEEIQSFHHAIRPIQTTVQRWFPS